MINCPHCKRPLTKIIVTKAVNDITIEYRLNRMTGDFEKFNEDIDVEETYYECGFCYKELSGNTRDEIWELL